MLTRTQRPYAGETDLHAIVELINTCDGVDRTDSATSATELRRRIETPGRDKVRDFRLWHDSDNQLLGYGSLWIPESGEDIAGSLWFYVHPENRNGSIESEIVAWGEARIREVARERGIRVSLHCGCRDTQTERQTFLEGCDFTPARYFFTMARSLSEPIQTPEFPAGFRLHQAHMQQNAPAYVEMFNQSFIDHWNHSDLTVEQLEYFNRHPDYRPELDLVAIAPDGTFATFCYAAIDSDANQRYERNEGGIEVLGTRRGFRKRGLGRAMLLSGLQGLRDAGVETAKLGVDSQNPSGALRLYESVGFDRIETWIAYAKVF
ncbi:GNAT family N-acetyltransferase [Oscillatoriales cyanobacterium LEGE 11467]|uniref:GNAT family N-acetyltransferase n=2 Tax=Zarconia TaxID=2992130 RepID=A0A928W110_9CYAN|nr:GNAT family N-acetyltransferase [Zarconia navalis LEGE 11467]